MTIVQRINGSQCLKFHQNLDNRQPVFRHLCQIILHITNKLLVFFKYCIIEALFYNRAVFHKLDFPLIQFFQQHLPKKINLTPNFFDENCIRGNVFG